MGILDGRCRAGAAAAAWLAAGAGVAPEKKQKEMEQAVAKAANSPNADLTKLQCGNLVYAGNKSSICFADKFLSDVARQTRSRSAATSPR